MMYEHHNQPLLSVQKFFEQMLMHGRLSFALLIIYSLEDLSWIDALVNASMILGDMGPVNPLQTTPGKVFASFYALYSGMIFLIIAGVMLTPVAQC